MSILWKKPFLFGGLLVLAFVGLPVSLYLFNTHTSTQSSAEKTVNLFYQPGYSQTTPLLQIPAGSTFTLDVYLDPGANAVSFVKLQMTYDPTKFEPAGGFIPDQNVFSQVVEGPIDQPGTVTATLSVGTDLSKAVRTRTKIGTLALKALENDPTNISSVVDFGSGSQALSVSSNSSYDENVIANKTPVTIQINKPNVSCGTSPGDTMLVMDTSGSMNDQEGSSGTKISNAIASAGNFINIVSGFVNNRIGLVSFSDGATLKSPLTSTVSTVKSQVNTLTANGGTCLQCGIDKTNQEISADKRTNIKNAVIILTDGLANEVEGSTKEISEPVAEQAALTAAAAGHSTNGTVYYTIGLGKDVDSTFLQQLAESTGGQYYFSPTTDQLNDIYNQISQNLSGGSVTGTVFNDANGNGVFEPTEPGLPGVLMQLYPLNSSTPSQIISSDSDGTYTIPNVCDGTYTLKQNIPTTWKETLPSDIRGYTFTMVNGKAVTDQNFGDEKLPRCSDGIDNDGNGFTDAKDSTCHTDGNPNNPGSYNPNLDGEHGNSTCSDSKDNNGNGLVDGQDPACHTDGNPNNPSSYDPSRDEGLEPTPTLPPKPTTAPTPTVATQPSLTPAPSTSPAAGTTLELNVLLHDIGHSGDNANPTAYSYSNQTPGHPTRNAFAQIYDINNNFVGTASGTIKYSSASGSFIGDVYLNKIITPGNYTVYVGSDYHLIRRVPTIQNLVANQINHIPQVALIAGDVNNDNELNILDYNLIMFGGCYSDFGTSPIQPTSITPTVFSSSPTPLSSSPAATVVPSSILSLSPTLVPSFAPTVAPTTCTSQLKTSTDLTDDGSVNLDDYNLFLREISVQSGD